MSELGRPFLHPDLRRLIETDRNAPDPPDTVKRSVALRVDRSLGLGGAMLGPAPGLGLQPPPVRDSATPSAPPPPPATIFGWKAVAGAVAAIVIGGAAALSVGMRPPRPAMPQGQARPALIQTSQPAGLPAGLGMANSPDVELQANRATEAPNAAPSRASHGAETAGATRTASRHRAAPRHAASSVDTLAAERTILDGARAALVHRDATGALGALRSHEQSFPRGQLLEERESMRVQALALSRDFGAARVSGEKFQRRFPRSMFLPAVERALEAAP